MHKKVITIDARTLVRFLDPCVQNRRNHCEYRKIINEKPNMPPDRAAGSNVNLGSFPWSSSKSLAEGLRNGDLNIATVLSHFNAVMRETLNVIEEYANEEIKVHLDRKNRVERMDKLIKDLTEKCQGMQQAMLLKDERYDEKCREAERYKVICELSVNNAINDKRNLRVHEKMERSQSYLHGNFTKPQCESKLRQRLDLMGGINVNEHDDVSWEHTIDHAPEMRSVARDYQNDGVKVVMMAQSNEVVSTNKSAISKMRQRVSDRDIHRQIAGGGPYTRMALSSRRKKEWPY